MIYLLALVGAIAVVVLLWRAFVARPTSVAPPPRRPRNVGPDDDPDFLRRLNERKPPEDEN